jgi:hypothetical protein
LANLCCSKKSKRITWVKCVPNSCSNK